MKIIKINLQRLLTDDVLFKQLCEQNPWGYIIESSAKTKFKIVPSQQWNQCFYKGHWSFSIMDNGNGH